MKNKLYIPKDEENNLFWISQSKEGLVISLNDFGYDGLHLTTYFKEKENNIVNFNVHITKEGEINKPIFEINFEFDRKEIELRLSKKIELIIPQLTKIIENCMNKSIEKPKDAFCIECFSQSNFNFKNNLSKRKTAKESLDSIKKLDSKDFDKMKLTYLCGEEKHNIYVDYINDKTYVKMPFGFLEWNDWEYFQKGLMKLFDEHFKEEMNFLESIFNQIKDKLGEIKDEE